VVEAKVHAALEDHQNPFKLSAFCRSKADHRTAAKAGYAHQLLELGKGRRKIHYIVLQKETRARAQIVRLGERTIDCQSKTWADLIPETESQLVKDFLDSLGSFDIPHLTCRILKSKNNTMHTIAAAQMFKTLEEVCLKLGLKIGKNARWDVETAQEKSFFGIKVESSPSQFSKIKSLARPSNELAWFGFEDFEKNGDRVHRKSVWIYAIGASVKETEKFLKSCGFNPLNEDGHLVLTPRDNKTIGDFEWFALVLEKLRNEPQGQSSLGG